jgi:hypothetical protein
MWVRDEPRKVYQWQEGGETVAEISDCSLARAGLDGKIRLAAIQAGVSLRFTISELKTLLGIALRDAATAA